MPYLWSFSSPKYHVNPYFPSFETKKVIIITKKSNLLEIYRKGVIKFISYFLGELGNMLETCFIFVPTKLEAWESLLER